jgi:hypothetical protein
METERYSPPERMVKILYQVFSCTLVCGRKLSDAIAITCADSKLPFKSSSSYPILQFVLPTNTTCTLANLFRNYQPSHPHDQERYHLRSSSRKILHSLRISYQTQTNTKTRRERTHNPQSRSHVSHEGENDYSGYGYEGGDQRAENSCDAVEVCIAVKEYVGFEVVGWGGLCAR